jgi:hypothetical protein
MFVIEKHDQKQLFQSYFMEYDWIWKVLVYGNMLDFYLIKRLKNDFKKTIDIIYNKNEFLIGQGIMVGGGDENPVPELVGLPYINTSKGDVKQFSIRLRSNSIWKHSIVHRHRDLRLYEAPALLITGGTNKFFKSVSAISYVNSVFRSSLTAVKAIAFKDLNVLKSINAQLNSNLFAYYITATGSSVGIERDETHDEEKFSFPYSTSTQLVELVTQIEHVVKEKYKAELEFSEEYRQIETKYNTLLKDIDKEILKVYQITEQEKALIDYAHEISIPLIKRRDKKRIFGALNIENQAHKNYLSAYAQIFTEHYNHIFNSDKHYFEVEVWHSAYMIGIYFKIIPEPSEAENQIIWKKDENTDKLLKKFAAISISNQSQNLFIQKDIKGFEENAFYVLKPNEYKCWHRAMAYLDLSEFMKAIMDSANQDHDL